MQLKRRRIGPALGLFTAELFAAVGAHGQEAPAPPAPASASINDDTDSDLGHTRIDTAVLFYQEAGGRVQATEPVVNLTINRRSGDILSLKFTSDTLTGATPNGATPWKEEQAFVKGDTPRGATSTGASHVVVAEPHVLPIDHGFKDQRYAVDAGYSFLLGSDTRVSVGGAGSWETDYRSYSASLGVSHDFNQKNTTAAVGVNLEYDQSRPFGGTPPPLAPIDGIVPTGANSSKTVTSVVAGITQVINRYWLAQINYSYGFAKGYQNDPYRLISVVDRVTGGPVQYLYEARPRSRERQSVYIGNKVALGAHVLDLSARAYKDSWGVKSITVQAADRIPVTSWLYVEPMVRYYHQSAADFFRYYLLSSPKLPDFASSDIRLGKFDAVTVGVKLGVKVGRSNELYVRADYYRQTGDKHPAGTPGDLPRENLFSGAKAASLMVGYSFLY